MEGDDMTQTLTPEALTIIAKVEKLLALAKGNANEHEAETATAKAMELLAAYNLDMAQIGKPGKGAQRNDTRLRGGLYGWQRDLWQAVAELNFCLYRSIRGLERGSVYEHRVIGSHVNVVSTKAMADYLQQTVERLAQEWARNARMPSVFVKEAIAYREGMTERLVERLRTMRAERLAQDRPQEAQRHRDRGGFGSQATPGTALILADVVMMEDDLNNDWINGYDPGTTSRWRAEQKARRVAAEAEAERLLKEREAAEQANPALKEERQRKEQEAAAIDDAEYAERCKREARNAKRRKGDGFRYRQETPKESRQRMSSFRTGYDKGQDIGLDPQVNHNPARGLK